MKRIFLILNAMMFILIGTGCNIPQKAVSDESSSTITKSKNDIVLHNNSVEPIEFTQDSAYKPVNFAKQKAMWFAFIDYKTILKGKTEKEFSDEIAKRFKNAKEMGDYFRGKLETLSGKYSLIKEIRGMGLMIGIQLAQEKAVDIKNQLLAKGFLVGNVGSDVVRILPPLIIGKSDIDLFIAALDEVLAA
jgi:hypothetical protein